MVLVLLVETFFRYVLVRPTPTSASHAESHTTTTTPCHGPCRPQQAERCSSQVITTSLTAGQMNSARPAQPDEPPRFDILCETVSAGHRLTGSTDTDRGGGGGGDGANVSRQPNAVVPDDCSRQTSVARRSPAHRARPPSTAGHVQVQACCADVQACARPCSCWTTVSSDIRYENEADGVVVYEARMIIPSSCRRRLDTPRPAAVNARGNAVSSVCIHVHLFPPSE